MSPGNDEAIASSFISQKQAAVGEPFHHHGGFLSTRVPIKVAWWRGDRREIKEEAAALSLPGD
ncbi:hypothetical protein, partial [Thermomonas sp.]|uniref:hypothetical protein n=1 Tax=Thermomonas sp. TaxID=1971895 RepID=UPI00262AE28B